MNHSTAFKNLNQALNVRSNCALSTPPELSRLLSSSSLNNHIFLIETGFKITIGYLAWMRIDKESLLFSLKTGLLPAHPKEWNEGRIMLLYDIVFLNRWEWHARDKAIEFLAKQRMIGYYRNNKVKTIERPERLLKYKQRSVLGDYAH